jgi:pimeloyl-ACP methyl ester carboxylesterase
MLMLSKFMLRKFIPRFKSPLLVPLVLIAVLAAGCAIAPTTTNNAPVHEADTVQANGINLAYESFGPTDRETILLIGGVGEQLIDWNLDLIRELVARGYRVIAYDNRDVGLSTKFSEAGLPDSAAITQALQEGKPPPFPYTLRDMSDDAVGLLDVLGVDRAHIVGHSMGGAIAQLVAIEHPERVASLTLLSTNSGNPAIPAIAKPEAFANVPPLPALEDKDAYVDYQVKLWQVLDSPGYPLSESEIRAWVQKGVDRSFDPAAFVRHQTASLLGIYDGGYRLSNLKNIKAPTVVLHGADDPLVPVEAAQELAAEIPNAELRLIPGLGHGVPSQLVPEFADAITTAAERASG